VPSSLTARGARGFFRAVRVLANVRRSAVFLALLTGASWHAPAFAAPPPDEGAAVKSLGADTVHAALVADPLTKARAALTRAHSMDLANDPSHAEMMRAVAREWIAVARDLIRTTDAEALAEGAEKKLDELETKTVRGRALLEETVARRARATAVLEQLAEEAKAPPPVAGVKAPHATQPAKAGKPSAPAAPAARPASGASE
jgi:hypothetical protein